jgi:putative tryptophan/tyrosine transport system substrate-binding protein
MRGIVFAVALAVSLFAPPRVVEAQSATKVFRVVELNPIPSAGQGAPQKVFRQTLRDLGYVQGKSILVEDRFAAGSEARLREDAAEAVRLKADVILAVSSAAVRAAANATTTIPIVAVDLESDPVASGLVSSLAHPGGNLTGFFLDLPEVNGKRLEQLKEAIPGVARVAILVDPTMDPAPRRAAEVAARSLGLSFQVVEARGSGDLEGAFREAVTGGSRALMIIQSPMLAAHPRTIADLAAKHRLPSTSIFSFFTEAGLLMSYGPNLSALFREAASYVDRILKGAKPGDLPVQRPTRFELILNQKAARVLGLSIPQTLLLRADRLIE